MSVRGEGREEGETCHACGQHYAAVYWLSDEVWARITPRPESPGGGLLCPSCADQRACAAGIPLYWRASEDLTSKALTASLDAP